MPSSAPGGATRYRKSMDTGSWHRHENTPVRWMTTPVTRAAKAQSSRAKPRICPEPNKHDTVFFFPFIIFYFLFFHTFCGLFFVPYFPEPFRSLRQKNKQAASDQSEFPHRGDAAEKDCDEEPGRGHVTGGGERGWMAIFCGEINHFQQPLMRPP